MTFTNKAAGEMRFRPRDLLGEGADAMWIGTFHATCARLLRRFGEHVGLTRSFVIFDDDDQVKLVEKLLKETGFRRGGLAARCCRGSTAPRTAGTIRSQDSGRPARSTT